MASCRSFSQLGLRDEEAWWDTYRQELLFKLWIMRVLGDTVAVALGGDNVAIHHLHRVVESYTRRSASCEWGTKGGPEENGYARISPRVRCPRISPWVSISFTVRVFSTVNADTIAWP